VSNWTYLTLHIRVIYPPKISGEILYGWLSQVFQNAGVQVRLGSTEQLNRPEFYDVDPGSCPLDGSVTPQLAALHSQRGGMLPLETAVYFVRSVSQYNACSSHAPNVPACVISNEVWPWTMAHELGHVLGLRHTDDSHNLMYAYGVQNITNPPPILTDEQREAIRRSPYVHYDTPELADVRALLNGDLPDSKIVANLTHTSHPLLKILADSSDPILASRAVYVAGLLKSPESVLLAKAKLNDPHHAIRHAAAATLGITLDAQTKSKKSSSKRIANKGMTSARKLRKRRK
jgi:hypothetical protein